MSNRPGTPKLVGIDPAHIHKYPTGIHGVLQGLAIGDGVVHEQFIQAFEPGTLMQKKIIGNGGVDIARP